MGHVPALEALSVLEGPVAGTQTMNLAIALPVNNPKVLDDTLNALYDPASPTFHQFLTPQQFADRFAPTQAQYNAVAAYARSKGLTVTGTHAGRMLLDVQANAATVEAAFSVNLNHYLSPSGREFFAPDADPTIDGSMKGLISGVIGLDDVAIGQPAIAISHKLTTQSVLLSQDVIPSNASNGIGSGLYSGLTPSDIRMAYGLNPMPANGTGQSVALFEADGFIPGDISAYETAYQLPNIPLQVVPVDGGVGSPGPGQSEVTLDIEMLAALAPNLSKIYIYEMPDNPTMFADGYTRIADDDLANQVSTSWYAAVEGQSNAPAALVNSENAAFEKMAADGQSMFSASGDDGAYANGSTLSVQDPGSQPWLCSVGGTTLSTNGPGGSYASETTWMGTQPKYNEGGSGGGVSTIWPIPAWQAQLTLPPKTVPLSK